MVDSTHQDDSGSALSEATARSVPPDTLASLGAVAKVVGGAYKPRPGTEGAVAYTHFDTRSSEDNALTILLTKEHMPQLPSQTLVRIKTFRDDNALDRIYLGTVVAGPFAEPDGFRPDSPLMVTTTVQGGMFLPRYQGRAYVQILGEESDGQVIPPRYRPRPDSPVFPLTAEETARVLNVGGNARLGLVVGQDKIVVGIPTDKKSVLPRHLGILGTTGSGKSISVATLGHQLQRAGVATVLFDVEGEYTEMDLAATDPQMVTALKQRHLGPDGTRNIRVRHLVGRETSREASGGSVRPFCLQFADLSPHAVIEILDLSPAQQERFLKAYDTLKLVMRDVGIFPKSGEDNLALEVDELAGGYPRMTLLQLIDVAGVFADMAGSSREERTRSKGSEAEEGPYASEL